MTNDEQLRALAKERVDFRTHLVVFLAVNLLLFAINMLSTPGAWWFYWVTIFWGFGVLMHGFTVYVSGGKYGEAVMVEKEYQKLKAKEDVGVKKVSRKSRP